MKLHTAIRMRAFFVMAFILAFGALLLSQAKAEGVDTPGVDGRLELLRFQTGDVNYGTGHAEGEVTGRAAYRSLPLAKRQVAELVKAEARRQHLPHRLVQAAERIAYVESRFRCGAVGPRTRYGRALGPLQIMPSSARALGFTGHASELNSCGAGLVYGVKHMVRCVEAGVQTPAELARCHVAGWANRHLRDRYANFYVAMVVGRS